MRMVSIVMATKHTTTQPQWFPYEDAAIHSGLSIRLLQELVKDNLIVSSLVKRPGATRGRRLINCASLDAWIREGIGGKSHLPQFDETEVAL